jgi:hypothetical protein
MPHQEGMLSRFKLVFLGGTSFLGMVCLAGCARETQRLPAIARSTSTPTPQPATRTAPPARTQDPTAAPTSGSEDRAYAEWLATRPRYMEAYGFEYDPSTEPVLPVLDSLCMPIWYARTLPLRSIAGEPSFVARPMPDAVFSTEKNLIMLGCMEGENLDLYCRVRSRLLDYDCQTLYKVPGVYADTGPVQGLIALCGSSPASQDEPREAYLYRTGAAFLQNIAYFFLVDRSLRLIGTPAELRDLFAPIQSPEEAVNYAQLMTGLDAVYQLVPEPEYIYFYDPVDATRVENTTEGYRVFLFHSPGCGCEPWINSEVELLVNRDGSVTWLGAKPWSMTIGQSCAD